MSALVLLKDKDSLKTINIIVEKTTVEEKQQLLGLLNALIDIRQRNISKREKIKQTLGLFKQSKAALPLIRHIKALVWDNRSAVWKIGIGAMIGTAALMPGNAGIVALGGGIGVPLWVVVGGGYSFAVLLADRLKQALSAAGKGDIQDAVYSVINE